MEDILGAAGLAIIVLVGGILFFAFWNPTISSSKTRDDKEVVEEDSDGDGSNTWRILYYADGTGLRTVKRYFHGDVDSIVRQTFRWQREADGRKEVIHRDAEVIEEIQAWRRSSAS